MTVRTDVLIVGAGPAGGHLARKLAQQGVQVLLTDRLKDLHTNAFSSAGTLWEALARFDLPESLVGSSWRHLEILSTQERGRWEGPRTGTPIGAVLDFGRLRTFLTEATRQHGGDVWLGARALSREGGRVRFERDGEEVEVEARLVIDATGPARSLMRHGTPKQTEYLSATGLEWLVEVPEATYARFKETLLFTMGSKWMPRGYGWVFPMEANTLKVGAGRFILGGMGDGPSLKTQIEFLLREEVRCPEARLIDQHGATLKYAKGLQDVYVDGPLMAIGDAVSTLNVLGGEGIRFAMEGAEIALPYVLQRLANPNCEVPGYRKAMHRRFKRAWSWSEELAIRKYLQDDDTRIDGLVRFLKPRDLDFLVDVLFHYNFGRAARKAGPAYLWRSLKRRLGFG